MAISKQKQNNIQILNTMVYNMSALSEWHAHRNDSPTVSPVVIAPMDAYQTKVLGRSDQLLLAVNNISFQEVKDTQGPVNSWEKDAGEVMEGWRGISFKTKFSLNDGDKLAMKNILDSSRLSTERDLAIPFVIGDFDDSGNIVPPMPDADGTPPPSITLTMPYGTGSGMVLRFAYRDYEEDFEGYPSVIVEVMLTVSKQWAIGSPSYTPMMRWDYSVILNSPNGRTPSDSTSRRRYDATKQLMRSALSALGVTPVAVGR